MRTNVGQGRRWAVVWVLSLSLFLVILDNSITSVALPSLARDMKANISQLQWIVDSYSLTFAGLLLPSGTIADRYGRKATLMVGLTVFGVCSALAAFAPTPNLLIIARCAQGVGAAMVFPTTLAILINVYTHPIERARAIGIWSATAGLAVALGPVIGGALLGHFWWGSTFLVNVPVVIAVILISRPLLPESKTPDPGRVDGVGLTTSVAAVVLVTYAIIEAPSHGWLSQPTLMMLAIGASLVFVFVGWERRHANPILDVRVFTDARFSAATVAITISFFALSGSIFLITQYLQIVRGYSTLSTGIHALPFAVGAGIAGPIASRLTVRIGTKATVTIGLALMTIGFWWMSYADATTPYWGLVARSMILVAAGLTLACAPSTEAIMAALPPHKAGVSSAVNDTSRALGSTLGVAAVGSVFSSAYGPRLVRAVAEFPIPPEALKAAKESVVAAVILANQAPDPVRSVLIERAQLAFLEGFSAGLKLAALATLVGAFLAWRYLPKRITATPGTDDELLIMAEPDPWDEFLQAEAADLRAHAPTDHFAPQDLDDMPEPMWATANGGDRHGPRPGAPVDTERREWEREREREWERTADGPYEEAIGPRFEYAVLSVERQDLDRVTLPDRTVRDVRRNQGMDVLEAWFDLHVQQGAEASAIAARKAWAARYAAWRSHVRITPSDGTFGGRRYANAPVDFVHLPDGIVLTSPSGQADHVVRNHYVAEVEREPGRTTLTFRDWLRNAEVHIEGARGWKASLRTGDRVTPLGVWVGENNAGPRMPEPALATLNRLGRQRWELVSIDDDNSSYGETYGRGAAPRAVHYVLKRPLAAVRPPMASPRRYPQPDDVRLS